MNKIGFGHISDYAVIAYPLIYLKGTQVFKLSKPNSGLEKLHKLYRWNFDHDQ